MILAAFDTCSSLPGERARIDNQEMDAMQISSQESKEGGMNSMTASTVKGRPFFCLVLQFEKDSLNWLYEGTLMY